MSARGGPLHGATPGGPAVHHAGVSHTTPADESLNQGLVSNASAPFRGVKQSGFGRESGHQGIQEYLSVKYVSVDAG